MQVLKAGQEAVEFEFFAKVHVGGAFGRIGNEAIERVTLPNEAHAEPEDAEAFFELLSGTDGPDYASDDKAPQAAGEVTMSNLLQSLKRRTLTLIAQQRPYVRQSP